MSKRDISAANEAALTAKVLRPIIFARLDFASGVLRFHTEIGPKTAVHPVFGSEIYTGVGDFGGIVGDFKESVSAATQPLRLAITGVKSALINQAFTDDYYRRDAEVMLGFDDETGALVGDPMILFSGFMDTVNIALGPQTGEMVLTCESRGTNLATASDWRFTDEDKQLEVSGDKLGQYIYRMVDLTLRWGDSDFRPPFRNSSPRNTPSQNPRRK